MSKPLSPEELIAKGAVTEEEASANRRGSEATIVPAEEKTFDGAAFDKLVGREESEPPKKEVEPKKEPEVKKEPEAPKVEEKPKEPEVVEDDTPITAKLETKEIPEESSQEDVSSLDANFQKFSKKMSNDARDWVQAIIKRSEASKKEVEELKAKVKESETEFPASIYQHEKAFLLDSNYSNIIEQIDWVTALRDHYREQLVKIKNGDEWEDFVQDSQGQIKKVVRKASPEADVNVSNKVFQASVDAEKLTSQKIFLEQNYGKIHSGVRDKIKGLEDKFFPQFKSPDFIEKNPTAKWAEAQLIKAGQKDNMLLGFCIKMYTALDEVLRNKGKTTKVAEVAKATLAGPTAAAITSGGVNNKTIDPDEIPFDQKAFDKYLNQ